MQETEGQNYCWLEIQDAGFSWDLRKGMNETGDDGKKDKQ